MTKRLSRKQLLRLEWLARLSGRDGQVRGRAGRQGKVCAMGLARRILLEHGMMAHVARDHGFIDLGTEDRGSITHRNWTAGDP
jgi:hypothetical protein